MFSYVENFNFICHRFGFNTNFLILANVHRNRMEKRNPFPLPVGRTGILLVLITGSLASTSAQRDKVHVYSLTEEQPPNTFVANLLIDSGLAARYSAGILSTLTFVFLKEVENLELFVLDQLNGILRTARSVDRDVICPGQSNCVLRLDIAVQPPAYFQVIKVELTILDINDNAPKFDGPRHHVIVSEGTPPGERFRLPSAVDVDSVANGVVEYLLLSTTRTFQLDVTQDPTGSRPKEAWLMIMEALDREREDRFELLVAAYDGGVPRRSAILTVDVQVEDTNDNTPKFDRPAYNVSVSESTPIGATIVRLFASDADVGQNGHVRYRFSQRTGANYGDLFAVDPESGDVVLLQTLDHAAAASYSLGVIAEDQGEFASPALAALVVNVVDINDHAPQIVVDVLSASGSVEVPENADVGTFVAHVSTLDKDGGDNGLVRCSINNNNFRLMSIYDGEYKLVTAAAFDRETVTRFEVVIRCHDMGEPRLHVSKVIIVNVADVNDNCPVFTHAVYDATVEENLPRGSFVVRVSAHDPDSGTNGDVVYLLDSDADQRFHVDPGSGVITVLATLDRETAETIEFHVLATNRGESGMLARAAVRVRVTDLDDDPPRFLSNRYVMAVAENLPPRTEVGRVTAEDRDLSPFNAFSFLLNNSRTFAIDPRLGTIFTKKPLDREKQSQYDVTVEVLSNTVAVTRDVTRVLINVIDANDNAPNVTFPSEFNNTVSVASTVKVHEVICTVSGHDLDLGPNSELVYEVIDGNGTTFFGVDPRKGHVTLLRDLNQSVNETLTLVLRVRDSGTPVQYSTATLHVAVADGNQSLISVPTAAGNQWRWLSDARLLVVAGIVAICLVFVAILATAILLVRRRNRRRRAKIQLAMMKTEMVTMQGRKDDDDDNDDGDSIKHMKMMMNDGKMVRMKDVSFTELNANAPCIVSLRILVSLYLY